MSNGATSNRESESSSSGVYLSDSAIRDSISSLSSSNMNNGALSAREAFDDRNLSRLSDSELFVQRFMKSQAGKTNTCLNLSHRHLTIIPPSLSKATNIARLYLNNNSLISPPCEILQLTALQELTLDHNCLTMLPMGFSTLICLEILSLSYNPLCIIPDELAALVNLTHLWLHACQILHIPDSLFEQLSRLKHLGLSFNELSELPQSIGKCRNLEWLAAEENNLTSLPENFSLCTKLNFVNLNSNKCAHVPDSLVLLAKEHSLKQLFMRHNALSLNCLTDDILVAFCNATKVDLRENNIPSLPQHWKGISNIHVGEMTD